MRDVNYTNALQSIRQVSGRVTVRDVRLRFTQFPATETIVLNSYDSDWYSSEILRVGMVGTDIYFSSIHPDDADFTSPTWTDSGLDAKENSRVGLYANRLFYQGTDNAIYYADFDGSAFGTPVKIADYAHADFATATVSLAPVSATEVYALSVLSGTTYHYGIINLLNTSAGNEQWHGTLYEAGDETWSPYLDAVRVSGVDYVYFTTDENKRTRYLKKDGDWWSDLEYVIPIDIVDDTSLFRMHSVTTINNKVLMVGTLKRKYGLSMLIYTFGPEEFTLGRDMFIRSEDTDEIGGKFFLDDDTLWCVGANIRHSAPATYLVGYNNASKKYTSSNFFQASISCPADGANSISVEFPLQETHDALRSGSELVFEAKVGDQYSSLGTYIIEAVRKEIGQVGSVKMVTGRSKALKSLMQWESDAAYDYWSQTKVNTNVGELTKLVRAAGHWTETEDPEIPVSGEPQFAGLILDDYNVGGYLYSVDNPSRNGQVVCEFAMLSDNVYARPVFGVGMGYYRESRYQAAERLGVETSEIEDADYGQNGILGLYTSGTVGTGDNPHFFIAQVSNNVITPLATSSEIELAQDTKYHIMLKMHEGQASVYYRAYETTKLWTLALTTDIRNAEQTAIPWFSQGAGRSFVYALNSTPHATGGPIGSEDLFIPVADNGDFPATGTVILDDEHMDYAHKSNNYTVSGLQFSYGDVLSSVTSAVTGWAEVGKDRNATFLRQIFTVSGTWYVRAISLFVKKVGAPKDGLMVWFGSTGMNVPTRVTDMISEQMEVKSEDITTEGNWVTIVFPRTVVVTTGCRLIITRANSATHPQAIDGSNNHYLVSMCGDQHGSGSTPNLWKWNEDTDIWSLCGGANNDTRFYIYGSNSNADDSYYEVGMGYNAELSTTDDYYNNCALVATEGAGAGTSMMIYGYKYTPAKCAWFMVDRNPAIFDDTTVFKIVPTLYGLTRGVDDTDATTHLEGTVSLVHDGYFSNIGDFIFLSGEDDISVAEMVEKLCRKAGLEGIDGSLALSSSFVPSTFTETLERKNLILELSVSDAIVGTVIFEFVKDTGSLKLELGADYLKMYDYTGTLQDHLVLSQNILGTVKISHWDGCISVWLNDLFLHGWHFGFDETWGDTFAISGTSTQTFGLQVYDACMRIDNHIMDNYRKGYDLLGSIIGQKRVHFHDAVDGRLKVFTDRVDVNTIGTPYNLSIEAAENETDVGLITRLVLEGVEVHERFDSEMIVEHGNIFHGSNMDEIYSQWDAEYYTKKALDDFGSVYAEKAFTGAADPRIEQNDMLYVTLPSGVVKVLADHVAFSLLVTEASAEFDMQISARVPRSEL